MLFKRYVYEHSPAERANKVMMLDEDHLKEKQNIEPSSARRVLRLSIIRMTFRSGSSMRLL